tara:strand:+ start:1041 stop:1910 length:870 start_codon:yes stop_codon:yes gene_type:complete
MKKILITGYTGMLGWDLYKSLKRSYDVYSISSKKKNNKKVIKFNLKNKDFSQIKYQIYPDIIIHCAAETNVDKCEIDKKNCKKINFDSVKKLIQLFPKSKFIFISSDSVYNGAKSHLERKADKPKNYYGVLKLKAENYIRKFSRNYFILRTTPVGLPGINKKKTFASWIIESVKKKKTLNLFSDVFFSPISTTYLLKEIKFIIKNNLQGTYNISSKDKISKFHFGEKLCKKLNLNTQLVKSIKSSNIKLIAKRNKFQVLNCNLYQKKFTRSLPSVSLTINDISNNYSRI